MDGPQTPQCREECKYSGGSTWKPLPLRDETVPAQRGSARSREEGISAQPAVSAERLQPCKQLPSHRSRVFRGRGSATHFALRPAESPPFAANVSFPAGTKSTMLALFDSV